MRYVACWTVSLLLTLLALPAVANNFPYREYYPEVNIVELADLKAGYDRKEFVIVDVRSVAEFEAIHIKGAVNLPYSNAQFSDNLKNFAGKHPGKKIAVYCNGFTCIKSYKAAEDAVYTNMPNVYAFDGGIGAWARAYPADTLLNNKEISAPEQQLISEERFKSSCMDFASFKEKAKGSNAVLIDARDPIQRKEKLPGLDQAMLIPMDKLVENIITKGNMKDKELYIFDQVGRQVNWLMYYLVANGYTNFHFLDGGATTVLKTQEYR